MIYYENGSSQANLSKEDLKQGLYEALKRLGERKKILAVPPDYTRLPSRAGELTEMTWEYYGDKLTDILPALGTHTPMTAHQISHMFGETPETLFGITTGATTCSPWVRYRQNTSGRYRKERSISPGRRRLINC